MNSKFFSTFTFASLINLIITIGIVWTNYSLFSLCTANAGFDGFKCLNIIPFFIIIGIILTAIINAKLLRKAYPFHAFRTAILVPVLAEIILLLIFILVNIYINDLIEALSSARILGVTFVAVIFFEIHIFCYYLFLGHKKAE